MSKSPTRRESHAVVAAMGVTALLSSLVVASPAAAVTAAPVPDGIYVTSPWAQPGGTVLVNYVGSTPECGNGFDGTEISYSVRTSTTTIPIAVNGFGEGRFGIIEGIELRNADTGVAISSGSSAPLVADIVVTCTPEGGGATSEVEIPFTISATQPSTPYRSSTAWTWTTADEITEGATITVSALGFHPGETATVAMLNESIAYAGDIVTYEGAVAGPVSVTADGEGAVTGMVTVPAGWQTGDDLAVIVSGTSSRYLLAPDQGDPLNSAPSISIGGNARAFAGGSIQVDASGFPAGAQVVIALHSAAERAIPLTTLVANSAGVIRGTANIPAQVDSGSYRVWAGAKTLSFLMLNTPLEITDAPVAARVAGADRYSTAVEVSARIQPFAPDEGTVYLASGLTFPDALGAGALAAQIGAPVLLTDPNSLPQVVADELTRLMPAEVIIVGGAGAVSSSVFAAVENLAFPHDTTRVGGQDRYATNRALVSDALSTANVAYIAAGATFPDALAAGPAAASVDGAVILVDGAATSLDTATLQLLDALGVTEVRIVGGVGAVSAGIQAQLESLFPGNVSRFGGSDRYETAALIVAGAWEDAVPEVLLASGANFPDALAAGAIGVPLLTTRPTCIPAVVLAQLGQLAPTEINVVGGTGALSSSVATYTRC